VIAAILVFFFVSSSHKIVNKLLYLIVNSQALLTSDVHAVWFAVVNIFILVSYAIEKLLAQVLYLWSTLPRLC